MISRSRLPSLNAILYASSFDQFPYDKKSCACRFLLMANLLNVIRYINIKLVAFISVVVAAAIQISIGGYYWKIPEYQNTHIETIIEFQRK